MSVREEFEQEYQKEELELLILVKKECGGAVCRKDMLEPFIEFLASVDIRTGTLMRETGRLEWLIKEDENRKDWGYEFKKLGIYHVKVRKCIPKKLAPETSPVMNNRYMLVDILGEDVQNPELEKLREQYKVPIVVEHEAGTFTLDRDLSWFEGEVNWFGETFTISLEPDEPDGDEAEQALAVLKELYEDRSAWNERLKKFAAEELTEDANDWLEDSDSEEEPEEITKERFAERIGIESIVISPNGDMTFYYYDDDMFWGHTILVEANISGEIEDAYIAG